MYIFNSIVCTFLALLDIENSPIRFDKSPLFLTLSKKEQQPTTENNRAKIWIYQMLWVFLEPLFFVIEADKMLYNSALFLMSPPVGIVSTFP